MVNVRVTVRYKYLFSTEHLIRISSWYIIRHNNHTTPHHTNVLPNLVSYANEQLFTFASKQAGRQAGQRMERSKQK